MLFYEMFLKFLTMTLTASVVILVVLLVRLALKQAPKIFSYALWAVVLFRLLCPVSYSSNFSLLRLFSGAITEENRMEYFIEKREQENFYRENSLAPSAVPERLEVRNSFGLKSEDSQLAGQEGSSLTDLLPWKKQRQGSVDRTFGISVKIAAWVWWIGIFLMAGYSLVHLGRLRKCLQYAKKCSGEILPTWWPGKIPVYQTSSIASPFVLGICQPSVYLPNGLGSQQRLTGQEQEYILLHEWTHIHRGDYLIKLIAFLALCLHWFNPLVWAAYVIGMRDMEMSCDESVMRKLGGKKEIQCAYSASLLSLATGRRIPAGTPLAFGEGDTSVRIRNVLRYKKPTVTAIVAALAVVLLCVTACAGNPKREENADEMEKRQENDFREKDSVENTTLIEKDMKFTYSEEKKSEITDEVAAREADTKGLGVDIGKSLEEAVYLAILGNNPIGGQAAEGTAIRTASYVPLLTVEEEKDNKEPGRITVYMMAMYKELALTNGRLVDLGGSHMAARVIVRPLENGLYRWEEYWRPGEGSYYKTSLEEEFPKEIFRQALDTQWCVIAQIQDCYRQAVAALGIEPKEQIAQLFDEIRSDPVASSSPGPYIKAHIAQWRELIYFGDFTVQYCFSRFEEGGQTGLLGSLMMFACQEILPENSNYYTDMPDKEWETGQDWYNALYLVD